MSQSVRVLDLHVQGRTAIFNTTGTRGVTDSVNGATPIPHQLHARDTRYGQLSGRALEQMRAAINEVKRKLQKISKERLHKRQRSQHAVWNGAEVVASRGNEPSWASPDDPGSSATGRHAIPFFKTVSRGDRAAEASSAGIIFRRRGRNWGVSRPRIIFSRRDHFQSHVESPETESGGWLVAMQHRM